MGFLVFFFKFKLFATKQTNIILNISLVCTKNKKIKISNKNMRSLEKSSKPTRVITDIIILKRWCMSLKL